MLPFDNRPWAKPLAAIVIGVTLVAAGLGAYYLYTLEQLSVPEITGIVLLLLTIIPPNVAVLLNHAEDERSPQNEGVSSQTNVGSTLHRG